MNKVTKLIFFASIALALFSCSKKTFTLSGRIDGTQAKEAFLSYGEITDTIEVLEGKFEFKGKVTEPTMAILSIEGRQTSIMIENSDIIFEGAIDALIEAAITGSKSQIAYDTFIKENGKHQGSQQEYLDYCLKFCEENKDQYITPYVIANIARYMQPTEIADLMNSLSPEVQNSEVSVNIKKQLDKILATEKGKQAPDFTMNDTKGNPVKLSDVYSKNKYTLIDFWASWCGPCRAENPNIVADYNEYSAKGFGIIGVSLDKDKAAWLKAIEDDKLTWVHVSDLKGWENAAAKLYNIQSIPSSFLVDSEGKIVTSNLRGKDLSNKLAELLN